MTDSQRLMTVGELKQVLAEVQDGVSVSIVLPPGTPATDNLTVFLAARVRYAGGPVLSLVPASVDRQPLLVTESFEISNRGVGVLLDTFGAWGLGELLGVQITSPDGHTTSAPASVELVRRSSPHPHELPALLVHGVPVAALPKGSTLVVSKHQ
jgi:hypothetical protein